MKTSLLCPICRKQLRVRYPPNLQEDATTTVLKQAEEVLPI